MRKTVSMRLSLILVIIVTMGTHTGYCQNVKSNVVKFKVSNIQDTSPPSIKISSPGINSNMSYQTDKSEINIVGEVKDSSGVRFVSVNNDVRTINEAGVFTSKIELVPGYNTIKLAASDNKDNFQEQYITIRYTPPVVTLSEKIIKSSKYYGLIIGVDSYQDPNLSDLDNPINDAEKVYNTLISKYTFEEDNMMILKNAKRTDIVNALDYLASTVTANDNLLIFYAGHGNWDERADVGYWLPSDAYLSSSANWFRNSTLVDFLKLIDSKHTLLITDACFAGSIFKSRSGFGQAEKAYEILYELTSRKAMTSGTFTEVPDRSSFTRYLLERLDENTDTYLSSWELFNSFRIAVINNSDALPQYGEIQYAGDEGGDFIFLKKE